MVTIKKYRSIPKDIFNHIHFDSEGGNFWSDSWECDDDYRITHQNHDCWSSDDPAYDDAPF